MVAKENLVPIRGQSPACERPKDSTTKQPAALQNFSRLWRRIYVGDGSFSPVVRHRRLRQLIPAGLDADSSTIDGEVAMPGPDGLSRFTYT